MSKFGSFERSVGVEQFEGLQSGIYEAQLIDVLEDSREIDKVFGKPDQGKVQQPCLTFVFVFAFEFGADVREVELKYVTSKSINLSPKSKGKLVPALRNITGKQLEDVLGDDNKVGALLEKLAIDKPMVMLNVFKNEKGYANIEAILPAKRTVNKVSNGSSSNLSKPLTQKIVREVVAGAVDQGELIPGNNPFPE